MCAWALRDGAAALGCLTVAADEHKARLGVTDDLEGNGRGLADEAKRAEVDRQGEEARAEHDPQRVYPGRISG